MPSNKNALTRYQILDELLSNRFRHYSLDDMLTIVNDRLEEMDISPVGKRCIQKDIAYLKGEHSNFFAEIESYTIDVSVGYRTIKKQCLRYADSSFSIFKKVMSDDEKYLLSQAITILGQFDGLPGFDGLCRLRSELGCKSDHSIVSFCKNPLDDSNLFGVLFSAISNKQVLRLSYRVFDEIEDIKTIVFHPHLLKEYNRRWYLFGVAEADSKLLHFALDRIVSVEECLGIPYKNSDSDLEEFFDDIIGVTLPENAEVDHIVFWVSDKSKHYVIHKPIHESQVLYKNERDTYFRQLYSKLNGGAFFSIDCRKNYELIRELTSFGPELVVLTPQHIQNEIVDIVVRIKQKYFEAMN